MFAGSIFLSITRSRVSLIMPASPTMMRGREYLSMRFRRGISKPFLSWVKVFERRGRVMRDANRLLMKMLAIIFWGWACRAHQWAKDCHWLLEN